MFTYTCVRLAWSLLTTILPVLIYVLPCKILIKISASPIYVDTDKECVLQPTQLFNEQSVLVRAWEIFIPTVAILVVSLVTKSYASSGRPVPRAPRRSHSVLAAPGILDDGAPFSLPPLEEMDDACPDRPQQPQYRGKSSTTASALDNDPSRRNTLQDQAILHPLIEEHDPDPGDDDIAPIDDTSASALSTFRLVAISRSALAIVKLLLLFLRRFLTSINSSWVQRPDNPSPDPAPTLHIALSVVVSRSSSLPDPRRPAKNVQLRAQTLARGSDIPLPYPIEAEGLNKSLSTGAKDLSTQDTGNISVLFVAADDDLGDPKHDLGVFQGILHQPVADPAMRFSPLADDDLTVETVRRWFTWLYLLAFLHRSKFLVFLAGRGNGANQMCLPGEALGEDNIYKWLSDARKRFKLRGAQIPTIILDICRSRTIPSVNARSLANVIRSCSPGELAQAIGFESKDVSSSCFYLAFFLAANDHPASPKAFKEAVVHWLSRVAELRSRIHDFWHANPGDCEDCKGGWICDQPKPQTLEQGDDGWSDLHQLGVFIATKHAGSMRNIVDRFHKEEEDIERWSQRKSAPSASQSSQTTSTMQDGSAVAQHTRGATSSVVQAQSLGAIIEG